ncbi:MAG: hypothetical protein HKP62_07075 [Sulfurovum sp.]|nr:hypothetical protein [Sulfurovum sp.]MBT8349189.1 hypothetical protein [Sulfurovum sp.]NNJ45761.1 hypothetical protein [Sulfurovum sp.]
MKKSILVTLLIVGLANGNDDIKIESSDSAEVKTISTDNTKLNLWKPTIAKKKSGKSCDDGNCINDLDCFTKDGKMYKAVTSIRDKVKKLCAKL